MKKSLAEEFVEEYMAKLFYFCLRKTGGDTEAEDLASDISEAVISELERGVVPENFQAWVWRIARNRYAAWAKRRRLCRERMSDGDIGELGIADPDVDVETSLIRADEISRMRRELAFISSDYRRIVVAYYIEDMSVRGIAEVTGLLPETVKTRLYRARKELKEGMEMAREFGVLSYKPENVSFSMNGGSGRYGEPWTILDRMLAKNILLAAYRNPSTSRELALELGVALPYMEDELRCLCEATLMRREGDRYEPTFAIVSADAQNAAHEAESSTANELTDAVIEIAEKYAEFQKENGGVLNSGEQTWEDMKWALLMKIVDAVKFDARDELEKTVPGASFAEKYRERPNGGRWELIGFENCDARDFCFVGLHGCDCTDGCGPAPDFEQYKFMYNGMDGRTPLYLPAQFARELKKIACGNADEVEENILSELEVGGYIRRGGDGIVPTFWVMFRDKLTKLTDEQAAVIAGPHRRAVEIFKSNYFVRRNALLAELPAFMKGEDTSLNFFSEISDERGAVLECALERGYLCDSGSRMIGTYLFV